MRLDLGSLVWLPICILFLTAGHCRAGKISCAFCPEGRSYRDQNGYLFLNGCNQEDVLPLRENCTMCAIKIVADNPWVTMVKLKTKKQVAVPYQIPEGSIIEKGCSSKEDKKAGTCEYTGKEYVCFCDKNFCNLELPPCSAMQKANPTKDKVIGCIETPKINETTTSKPTKEMKTTRPLNQQSNVDGKAKKQQIQEMIKKSSPSLAEEYGKERRVNNIQEAPVQETKEKPARDMQSKSMGWFHGIPSDANTTTAGKTEEEAVQETKSKVMGMNHEFPRDVVTTTTPKDETKVKAVAPSQSVMGSGRPDLPRDAITTADPKGKNKVEAVPERQSKMTHELPDRSSDVNTTSTHVHGPTNDIVSWAPGQSDEEEEVTVASQFRMMGRFLGPTSDIISWTTPKSDEEGEAEPQSQFQMMGRFLGVTNDIISWTAAQAEEEEEQEAVEDSHYRMMGRFLVPANDIISWTTAKPEEEEEAEPDSQFQGTGRFLGRPSDNLTSTALIEENNTEGGNKQYPKGKSKFLEQDYPAALVDSTTPKARQENAPEISTTKMGRYLELPEHTSTPDTANSRVKMDSKIMGKHIEVPHNNTASSTPKTQRENATKNESKMKGRFLGIADNVSISTPSHIGEETAPASNTESIGRFLALHNISASTTPKGRRETVGKSNSKTITEISPNDINSPANAKPKERTTPESDSKLKGRFTGTPTDRDVTTSKAVGDAVSQTKSQMMGNSLGLLNDVIITTTPAAANEEKESPMNTRSQLMGRFLGHADDIITATTPKAFEEQSKTKGWLHNRPNDTNTTTARNTEEKEAQESKSKVMDSNFQRDIITTTPKEERNGRAMQESYSEIMDRFSNLSNEVMNTKVQKAEEEVAQKSKSEGMSNYRELPRDTANTTTPKSEEEKGSVTPRSQMVSRRPDPPRAGITKTTQKAKKKEEAVPEHQSKKSKVTTNTPNGKKKENAARESQKVDRVPDIQRDVITSTAKAESNGDALAKSQSQLAGRAGNRQSDIMSTTTHTKKKTGKVVPESNSQKLRRVPDLQSGANTTTPKAEINGDALEIAQSPMMAGFQGRPSDVISTTTHKGKKTELPVPESNSQKVSWIPDLQSNVITTTPKAEINGDALAESQAPMMVRLLNRPSDVITTTTNLVNKTENRATDSNFQQVGRVPDLRGGLITTTPKAESNGDPLAKSQSPMMGRFLSRAGDVITTTIHTTEKIEIAAPESNSQKVGRVPDLQSDAITTTSKAEINEYALMDSQSQMMIGRFLSRSSDLKTSTTHKTEKSVPESHSQKGGSGPDFQNDVIATTPKAESNEDSFVEFQSPMMGRSLSGPSDVITTTTYTGKKTEKALTESNSQNVSRFYNLQSDFITTTLKSEGNTNALMESQSPGMGKSLNPLSDVITTTTNTRRNPEKPASKSNSEKVGKGSDFQSDVITTTLRRTIYSTTESNRDALQDSQSAMMGRFLSGPSDVITTTTHPTEKAEVAVPEPHSQMVSRVPEFLSGVITTTPKAEINGEALGEFQPQKIGHSRPSDVKTTTSHTWRTTDKAVPESNSRKVSRVPNFRSDLITTTPKKGRNWDTLTEPHSPVTGRFTSRPSDAITRTTNLENTTENAESNSQKVTKVSHPRKDVITTAIATDEKEVDPEPQFLMRGRFLGPTNDVISWTSSQAEEEEEAAEDSQFRMMGRFLGPASDVISWTTAKSDEEEEAEPESQFQGTGRFLGRPSDNLISTTPKDEDNTEGGNKQYPKGKSKFLEQNYPAALIDSTTPKAGQENAPEISTTKMGRYIELPEHTSTPDTANSRVKMDSKIMGKHIEVPHNNTASTTPKIPPAFRMRSRSLGFTDDMIALTTAKEDKEEEAEPDPQFQMMGRFLGLTSDSISTTTLKAVLNSFPKPESNLNIRLHGIPDDPVSTTPLNEDDGENEPLSKMKGRYVGLPGDTRTSSAAKKGEDEEGEIEVESKRIGRLLGQSDEGIGLSITLKADAKATPHPVSKTLNTLPGFPDVTMTTTVSTEKIKEGREGKLEYKMMGRALGPSGDTFNTIAPNAEKKEVAATEPESTTVGREEISTCYVPLAVTEATHSNSTTRLPADMAPGFH